MKELDYNKLVFYQKCWKDLLPPDKAFYYIELSKKLMHRAIENGNDISKITLRCPEDCPSYQILEDFCSIIDDSSCLTIGTGQKFYVTFEE